MNRPERFSVRLPPELKRMMDRVARQLGISRSELARRAIREAYRDLVGHLPSEPRQPSTRRKR